MWIFDYWYILIVMLPGMLMAGVAAMITKSTFSKYSKIANSHQMTGAEAAAFMLQKNGIDNVHIEHVRGTLTDHYDPGKKVLRLSDSVYDSRSIAAVGVACHEAGHALQDAQNYAFLGMRTALVPAVNFGSKFSYIIIFVGLILNFQPLSIIGCALFAIVFLFALITLPVEWDASARAKKAMIACNMLTEQEQRGASKVLNAAFLTYLASALTALLTLLYYLWRSGLLGGRR